MEDSRSTPTRMQHLGQRIPPFGKVQRNLILIAAGIFMVFLVILSTTAKRDPSMSFEKALRSLEKRDYYSTVESSMDVSTEPCKDFYQYVCGNWRSVNPTTATNFELGQRRVMIRMKQLVESRNFDPKQETSADKIVAGIQSCYNVRTDRRDDLYIVKDFLRENGLLKHRSVKMSKAGIKDDILNALVRLDMKYSLSITHSMRPSIDLRARDKLILVLELGMLLPGWMKAYKRGISEAAYVVGGENFYTNTVSVHTKVVSWTAEAKSSPPEYSTLRDMLITTYSDLTVERWLHAVSGVSPLNMTASTEVYISNPVGIMLTDKLVSEYSLRPTPALNWIAMILFHYLSSASSFALMKSFQRHRPSCTSYFAHVAPYALGALLTSKYLTEKQVAAAKHVRKSVMETAVSMFPWLDRESRSLATDRVKNITVILGFPSHLESRDGFDKHFAYLPRFGDPFVLHFLEALRTKTAITFRLYPKPTKASLSHLKAMAYTGDVSPSATARYIDFLHVVFLPIMFFFPPFIEPDSPAVSYGGFGHVLAHEIFHSFDTSSIDKDLNGTVKTWLQAPAKKAYDEKLQCVLRHYAAENEPGSWTYSLKTKDENFADIVAYQAILHALKKDERANLKGASSIRGLTNEQLFYVSLCHKWCTSRRNANPTTSVVWYPRPEHRCNIVLNTAKEFGAAFSCPRNISTLCLFK
ncbi:endothelin-converting enzyme 1-like [Ornithodoros turicata]|uniref:endothelin-converting enzyme 1-like n=1 Tax=Ornithodoros turicata TaxID=34597 RepID=UPI003138E0F2